MVSLSEQTHLANGVIVYMGQISGQKSSRHDNRLARSSELKSFLLYLSERAPSAMKGPLKLASQKCVDTLRVKKQAQFPKKRAEPPDGNETKSVKRVRITRPIEEETAPNEQVAGSDLVEQEHADARKPGDSNSKIKQESEQQSFDWTKMTDDTLLVSERDENDDASGGIVPQSSHKGPNPLPETVNPSIFSHGCRIEQHIAVQQNPQKAHLDVRDDLTEKSRPTSSNNGDEAPTRRSYSQISKITLPQKSKSERDVQSEMNDLEEENLDTKGTEDDHTSAATTPVRGLQDGGIIPSFTRYQLEVGLSMKEPAIEAYVRAHCVTLKPLTTRPHFHIHDEIDKILDKCRLLEFFKARGELCQYLENRVQMPGKKLQARTTWNVSNPGEILDALQTVKTNTADCKIHRAYGQTLLFSSVNTQVEEGYESAVTGHMFDHTRILLDLALKKAGSVSTTEKNSIISSYLYEYYAGQKWSAVIDWFGGSGIVLIFVTAGVGPYYVETKWTMFQRDCLQHIAGLLHSIRGLVETLGPEALEVYCQNGCLGTDCIDKVRLVKFTKPDGNEESEDESADGDEEPEDGSADGDEESEDESADGDDESEDESADGDEDFEDESADGYDESEDESADKDEGSEDEAD